MGGNSTTLSKEDEHEMMETFSERMGLVEFYILNVKGVFFFLSLSWCDTAKKYFAISHNGDQTEKIADQTKKVADKTKTYQSQMWWIQMVQEDKWTFLKSGTQNESTIQNRIIWMSDEITIFN